jgi:hypothetical protein
VVLHVTVHPHEHLQLLLRRAAQQQFRDGSDSHLARAKRRPGIKQKGFSGEGSNTMPVQNANRTMLNTIALEKDKGLAKAKRKRFLIFTDQI